MLPLFLDLELGLLGVARVMAGPAPPIPNHHNDKRIGQKPDGLQSDLGQELQCASYIR